MKCIRCMVAVCAALLIAVPAMAVEIDISGHYFVEGFNHNNEQLRDTDATNDYLSMELMVKPVFKINDNITLTTQFTALEDHVWGDDANAKYSESPLPPIGTKDKIIDGSNNFDWKAAYLTLKTPIGGFIIGRYIDTPWGLGLGDTTGSHGSNQYHKDRIMWVVPYGDFISGAVFQKNQENDKGNVVTDQDFTKTYIFSAYKQENWSTGLLFAKYTHKEYFSSKNLNATINQAAQAQVYAANAAAGAPPGAAFWGAQATAAQTASTTAYNTKGELDLWVLDPYFKGQFGPLGIEAEMLYGWGDVDQNGQGTDDIDAEGLGYFLDVSYDFGPVKVMGGTTFVEGDWDLSDGTASPMGYFERSNDHERGFLLTSDISGLEKTLGGRVDEAANLTTVLGMPMGNLSGGPGTVTGQAGAQMFYLDVTWQALDNLELGLFIVKSKADDTPRTSTVTSTGAQWDDDHGVEVDVNIKWEIMDNLTFKGVIAYLDAGDYWKMGNPNKDVENLRTFYGQLIVDF